MTLNIPNQLQKADINLFDTLRSITMFNEQMDTLEKGEQPVFSVDYTQPNSEKEAISVGDLVSQKREYVKSIEDQLGNMHSLERELVQGKLAEISTKLDIVVHTGTPEASRAAHELLGFDYENKAWFDAMYQALVPEVQAYFADKPEVQKPKVETAHITYNHFFEYLTLLASRVGLPQSILDVLIEPKDCKQCSFDRLKKKIWIPTDEKYYQDAELFKLTIVTAPHELSHLITTHNASEHPSAIARAIFAQGRYSIDEEGREKYRQISRISRFAEKAPELFPRENAEDFRISKELKESATHFLAYRMREQGATDLEIWDEIKKYSTPKIAARTTMRSRLGMPKTGSPFPGYLIYFAGLYNFKNLIENHPQEERLMQNGAMNISYVLSDDPLFQRMLSAGLVNKEPKILYDEDKIVDTAIEFDSRFIK